MTRTYAPWSDDQVAALNRHQVAGTAHPFTCGSPRHDLDSGHLLLIATTTGWRCGMQECDYTQEWAHDFMLTPPPPIVGPQADPRIRVDRETLTQRWVDLANSWPGDGWVGAGEARRAHAEKVRGVQELLRTVHTEEGYHGPFEVKRPPAPPGERLACICGERIEPTAADDARLFHFDYSTRTYRFYERSER